MLEKLIIKNYLLLKNIEMDLSAGFNIITGETGAGKSILINALMLLMGGRADYSIISRNKEKMIIEGVVKVSGENSKTIGKILKEHDIESLRENNIIIRRELYSKAYSRCFVNDSPVGTNELKEIGDVIIDIHSQNEHQSLLKKELHIELLDSYLAKKEGKKFQEKLESYKTEYHKLQEYLKEYESTRHRKEELDNKRNFIEFQLKEITEINPEPNEDESLSNELKTGENVEGIQQGLAIVYNNLYDEAGSVIERLKIVEKELGKIGEYNSDIAKILNDIAETTTTLNEASRQIGSMKDNLSFDPVRVEETRERLYKLQFLKKKYGGSISEVINLRVSLENDLGLVDNFDDKINELDKKINSARTSLFKKAQELSKIRKERSKTLETEVVKVLNEVGFENGEFKVEVSPDVHTKDMESRGSAQGLGIHGIDEVEFMVKINKGDEFTPLRKTASGGEVSRIMLAVKSVLADADNVDILVFDEIDSGISGRIAQKVGRVIKKLSEYHQVIAITHLAQIAALASEHYEVLKETEGEGTITRIRTLDKNEKVIEVAKLLSGEKVTDASIKSAKELMKI
jgi:DNA repair protein RecN (Recombination protein N)